MSQKERLFPRHPVELDCHVCPGRFRAGRYEEHTGSEQHRRVLDRIVRDHRHPPDQHRPDAAAKGSDPAGRNSARLVHRAVQTGTVGVPAHTPGSRSPASAGTGTPTSVPAPSTPPDGDSGGTGRAAGDRAARRRPTRGDA